MCNCLSTNYVITRTGERLSVSEEGRGGGSELVSDLDLDPDPWKILWIWIRQNDADPDPDPQHCLARHYITFSIQT